MKKFIKDWWPLLLIAGWWLWNRKQRSGKYAGSNNPIPPMPSQQRLIEDYIRQLEKAGYTRSEEACPICGSVLYRKTPPPVSAVFFKACTNPSCENFDPRFISYY